MNRRFRHRNKKKFWLAFPLIIGMIFLLVWLGTMVVEYIITRDTRRKKLFPIGRLSESWF